MSVGIWNNIPHNRSEGHWVIEKITRKKDVKLLSDKCSRLPVNSDMFCKCWQEEEILVKFYG